MSKIGMKNGKRVRNLLVIVAIFFLVGSFSYLQVRAAEEDSEPYPVPNDNLSDYLREKDFLTQTESGYERVYYNGSVVRIERYDTEFNKTGGMSIPMELSYWGGFYSDNDFYFLVEGEANTDEKDDAEVIRVIKYDKDWNRLGAASITGNLSLFGGDVRYPFDNGSVKMAEKDGILYIVTGHQSYVDPMYNMGHQGLLMMAVDIQNMTGSVVKCDNWHSFAQYIGIFNDDIYLLELSEGNRCTNLKKIETTSGRYRTTSISVFDYGGERTSAWALATRAYVDDLEISSENILGLGSSIDQSQYDDYTQDTSYNIYLTVTPLSDFSKDATTVKWLTEYNNDGKRFSGPSIVKINDNRFMVIWGESGDTDETISAEDVLSQYKVHYVFIDGAGNKIGREFVANAPWSDCHPILSGDKIVYYASNDLTVNFYTIDANTGSFTKKVCSSLNGRIKWTISDHVLRLSGYGPAKADKASLFSKFSDDIEKIIIEDGITEISQGMFTNLNKIQEVDLAETVEYVGDSAFARNDHTLKKVYVRGKNTAFGEGVFNTGYYWIGSGKSVITATIICWPGSTAEQYAKDNEIRYDYFIVPTEITLDSDKLTLQKGESQTLTASVIPEDSFDQSITWKSSNPGIATVDSNGVVKAVSGGKTVITARAFGGVEKNCEVTVIVNPESISIGEDELIMYFGNERKFEAILSPEDVTETKIKWNIDNTAIASMNNGTLRVWGAGKIVVTATTVNGLKATCNVFVISENNPDNPFADIKSGNWKYDAAMYVFSKGYMTGKGELIPGKVIFGADSPIRRSEFVQTLYSVEGKPDITYVEKFSDVKASDWFAKSVTWASGNGIVAGNPDNTFGVNGNATREQLALMLYKYAVYKGYDTTITEGEGKRVNDFSDAGKVSSWAENALNWALYYGIMSGTGDGRLNPKGNATRVQCAAMLRSLLVKIESGEIKPADAMLTGEELMEPVEIPEEELYPEEDESSEEEDVIPRKEEETSEEPVEDVTIEEPVEDVTIEDILNPEENPE